jgi:hypothetical protein
MAARFWVGGTGNWDAADTTHWAASSNGAGGQSVPGASDTVTFDASSGGGTVTVTADHTVTSVTGGAFTGTLDYGTGRTVSYTTFSFSGTGTRTLTLGNANIGITGTNAVAWTTGTATNLTFTSNTAIITFSGSGAGFTPGFNTNYNGTSLVFPNTNPDAALSPSGTTTVANITITGPANKISSINLTGNMTLTGTLTCNGNSRINQYIIKSSVVGATRTLTASTWSVTNTDFQDITGAGAGSRDFSAQNDIGDCGGNSGITFPASVSQTWNGASGGNWSTNAWTTRVPLPQDDVSLGVDFSASQTVTADMPRLGRSINWTGATGSPTFTNSTTAVSIFGSNTFISGMTVAGTGVITFVGRGSYSLTSAGKTYTQALTFTAPSGTYLLNDSIISNGAFTSNNGVINSNGFNVTSASFVSNSGFTRSNLINGSTITPNASSGNFISFSTSGLTLSADTTTFNIPKSSSTRTFNGGGLTFGTITYTVAGSTGELDITGSNSFAQINFSDASNARSLKFTAGTTTIIREKNGFNVNGTSGKLMTVASITGPAFTVSSLEKQGAVDYVSLTNCVATETNTWYAGANSVDNGGNTNWIFSVAPILGGSNNMLMGV